MWQIYHSNGQYPSALGNSFANAVHDLAETLGINFQQAIIRIEHEQFYVICESRTEPATTV